MENDSGRNTIIFVLCAMAILVVYQVFVLGPQAKKHQAELQRAQAVAAAQQHPGAAPSQASLGVLAPAPAVAASPQVAIDTPSLTGRITLRGARIDELYLKRYHVTPDPKSPMVELLRPAGGPHAWFIQTGWLPSNAQDLPDVDAIQWTAQPGARLTPQTPLVLTYDAQGVRFTRTISVDDNAMFTVADQVTNGAAQPALLRAYGMVEQQGMPADMVNSNIVHEGAVGILGGTLKLAKYKDWKKKGYPDLSAKGGWLGVTEKYWLSALIPDQSEDITAKFPVQDQGGVDVYKSGFLGAPQTIAPGQTVTRTIHVFAGAKTVPALKAYGKQYGIPKFDWAVDWGNLWFFTQPLFIVLEFLKGYIGSIGLSILALTVLVKLVFFPLANKSYESISKMKKIQPMMEALKKQHGSDQAKLQQETMALYQREKINPLMGCLPMLIQIPVFYSLYKVLTVTIEMRQAPFYGWIHDLAAKDPTTVLNLFGLIPWNPAHTPLIGTFLDTSLHIGAWPLIYGFTMWLSQAMNPPQADPTQQRIFQLMPIMFTFIMAPFTVGLLIYWSWNNVLSILQQYAIMRRFKVDNPIDDFIGRFVRPRAAE
ncbi:MAG: membrane protein insertase YidC [Caulobacteraceae bacterium]|nr:membrane protein insertase YidC [Caulobacteraceae bacterium]